MSKPSGLLKNQSDNKHSQFQEKWPKMRPVVLKLLRQQHVSRDEWQDLFWYAEYLVFPMTYYFIIRDVHLVTSWDNKGPVKIQKALEVEFDSFISGVKDVSYAISIAMLKIH